MVQGTHGLVLDFGLPVTRRGLAWRSPWPIRKGFRKADGKPGGVRRCRSGFTEADFAAIKEMMAGRKAAAFWVTQTTRTTGPSLSSQPHARREKRHNGWTTGWSKKCNGASRSAGLRCGARQLSRLSQRRKCQPTSAPVVSGVFSCGISARVKRSTYYCRRSTDVLAASLGSVW